MKIIYFLIFILFINNVYAFGISPVNFDLNIKNGFQTEQEFFVVNNENTNKVINISTDFEFVNFSNIILETEPNSEKNIKFLFQVPYETTEGEYEGRIYLKEIKDDEGGISLDTSLGIKITLNVESNYADTLNEKKEYVYSEQEFKEIPKEELNLLEYLKTNLEIVIFYSLIGLISLIALIRIFKNLF